MEDAAAALIEDEDDAHERLGEVLSTPCREKPASVQLDDKSTHVAACHLLSPESPGDQSHYEHGAQ
jgi:hypothetical protein